MWFIDGSRSFVSLGMMEVDATGQAGKDGSHLPEDIAMSYCFFYLLSN